MLTLASGTRIHLAMTPVDMRKGFDGLSMVVQQVLNRDPFGGQVFVFRGKRSHLIKILVWDGTGLCLFAKRLEKGRFVWPVTREGVVTLTPAQLSMLLEGIDWRSPLRTERPSLAG
jgi:transposase